MEQDLRHVASFFSFLFNMERKEGRKEGSEPSKQKRSDNGCPQEIFSQSAPFFEKSLISPGWTEITSARLPLHMV
jgi:hypothetical protein